MNGRNVCGSELFILEQRSVIFFLSLRKYLGLIKCIEIRFGFSYFSLILSLFSQLTLYSETFQAENFLWWDVWS